MHDSCNGYLQHFTFEFRWAVLELISDFLHPSQAALSYVITCDVIMDFLKVLNFCECYWKSISEPENRQIILKKSDWKFKTNSSH